EGGVDVLDVFERRHVPLGFRVVPVDRPELEIRPGGDFAGGMVTDEIADRAHRDRRGKTVGMADYPVRHEAAVGAAPHAQSRFIHETGPLDELVERLDEVAEVLPAPVFDDGLLKRLAVPGAATRVDVEDQETAAGQDLELVEEGPAVLAVRSAVDLHDQGPLAGGVESRRLEQPALQAEPVVGHELQPLREREIAAGHPGIEVGQALLARAVLDVQLAWRFGVGCTVSEHTGAIVPGEDLPLAANLRAQLSVEPAGP